MRVSLILPALRRLWMPLRHRHRDTLGERPLVSPVRMRDRESLSGPGVDGDNSSLGRWLWRLFAAVPATLAGFLGRCGMVVLGRDADLLDVVADETRATRVLDALLVEVVAGEGGDGGFWWVVVGFGGLGWQADVLPGIADQAGAAGGVFVALAVEHVAFGRAGGSGGGGGGRGGGCGTGCSCLGTGGRLGCCG